MRIDRRVLIALCCTLLAACATSPDRPSQPEASSTFRVGLNSVTATKHMAASANPLATEAGREVLRAGGSAVDAAIAIQMVLTLVEPQSSGIGGGAFLMHWDGRKVIAYDGRETAPMAADEKLFLLPDGKAMPFYDAVVGGRSVGTPGAVRMLEIAHKQYGKLPWPRLFEPAIRLAENGFPMSPRLNMQLGTEKYLKTDAASAAYFYNADGSPKAVGTAMRNPALAATLRSIAANPNSFYAGDIPADIVKAVRSHSNAGRPRGLGLHRLSSQAARAHLHRLQAVARLRLPAAVFRRYCGSANAWGLRGAQYCGLSTHRRHGCRRQTRTAARRGASFLRSRSARIR